MLNSVHKSIAFTHQDRQWDARFNVPLQEDLDQIVNAIRNEYESGKLKYILIGGPEIGTRPYQDDYQIQHIHVAAIFFNRVSKSSILKNWHVKQGNGYYLVPRNRDLPYSGWRNHHVKEFSKVDGSKLVLYEMGELPADDNKKKVQASEEEKKRKIDDVLIDMKDLLEKNQESQAFAKYPRNYLIYGERIKAMIDQRKDFQQHKGDPHIWLHGYPGTGKTAILSYVYPQYYKKNLYNKFFDLYNPKMHSHVMLEDLDHEAVERLSINFIKTICDESGFAVDQKYKTPQLARTTCLVTSNFSIGDIMPEGQGNEQNVQALYRRFWHVNIYNLLRVLELKLIPREQRNELKKEGNQDSSKLFITWDYVQDLPKCTHIESPEYYQNKIKQVFYST